MLKCPYCGSGRLQSTGGENGNPFDRRPEKTVCLDCGRTVSECKLVIVLCVSMLLTAGPVTPGYATFSLDGKQVIDALVRTHSLP